MPIPTPLGPSADTNSFAQTAMGSLPELRTAAESLMTDVFRAYAPDGGTRDASGYEVQGYAVQGDYPGKVQARGSSAHDTSEPTFTIGDVERPVLLGGLHIPITAAVPVAGPVGVGWEFECIETGPFTDPSLLGRRYLVVGVPAKSFATARRLDVVEL